MELLHSSTPRVSLCVRACVWVHVCGRPRVVVPLVGGPCSLYRRAEERSSGGRQNRRGCRSSASPPPVYPWSEEKRCPATGSPGTHTHVHTHTDTYTRDAGGQTSIARRRKHVHMRDMRGQRTRRETHTPLLRVKICQCAHAGMLLHFLMYSHSHICHAHTRTFHTTTTFMSIIPQNKTKQNKTHLREFRYVRDRSQINLNKSLSRTLSAFRAEHCSHLAKGSSITWMRTLISQVTHNFTIKALSTENGAITFDVSPQLGCSIPCWNNLRFKRLLLCSGYY